MGKNTKMKITISWPKDSQILKDVFLIAVAAVVIFAIFPPPWPVMFGVGIACCIILQNLYELFPGDCASDGECNI